MKRAVFLDRDGVLVKNIDGDYIREKSQIKLLPHAKGAVAKLNKNGFEIIIVTNQAGVNKGLLSMVDARAIQKEIENQLDPAGAIKIKSELCPHTIEEECDCRKPRPGMLSTAIKKYNLDTHNSYMIGDAFTDILAAQAAKVKPLFVLSGRGKASDLRANRNDVKIFNHIGGAADYICEDA